ncbi:quinone oxidoreductase-related [Anaeramoeba ignava]|uniref:Quinone oxidoreductase-related n=1 Tax=Anaeramoeba ignava TaxID=1746090 RepID=A0A9Q0LD77_ANAIG|nr:quinone oxidoreductase-related [Anaeramoeba ignava]
MKAVVVKEYGDKEKLLIEQKEIPKPVSGQILVKNLVSGINLMDIFLRKGFMNPPLPFTPGSEAAGIVEAVPEDYKEEKFKVGTKVVYASMTSQTYAEYSLVPIDFLVAIPEKISFEDACAIPVQGLTAHYLCHSSYAVKKGDTVLIMAGSGGVGGLLVQMCHMIGATVITTVSSEEKMKIAKEFGADHVINYTVSDFKEEVRKIFPNGVDAVFDSVGKAVFDKALECLRMRGYYVVFGYASGQVENFDIMRLGSLGSLNLTVCMFTDFVNSPQIYQQKMADCLNWVQEGKIKPKVTTFPLEKVADAHEFMESRKSTGKILLKF